MMKYLSLSLLSAVMCASFTIGCQPFGSDASNIQYRANDSTSYTTGADVADDSSDRDEPIDGTSDDTDVQPSNPSSCINDPDVGRPCEVGKGRCKNTGKWECNEATGQLACSASPNSSKQQNEEICGNDKDDDCDGTVDEDDACCNYDDKPKEVCKGQPRLDNGKCKQPDAYEENETSCGDGLDNDCNGATDCNDRFCDNKQCSGEGTECDYDFDNSGSCTEVACDDGQDNDGDGQIDCQDADCNACEAQGTTCRDDGSCEETNCKNGRDDDLDGKRDCLDPDCRGELCDECSQCPGLVARCASLSCQDCDC